MKRQDRAAAKSAQIINGARDAFIELGYEGTSVDDIASRAGVSKPTIYKHFPDKEALFLTFIHGECETQAARVFSIEIKDTDPRQALLEVARSYIDLIFSEFAQDIFRLAVSETKRFPQIGQVFYDAGIATGSRRLAQFLAAGIARDIFEIDDIELAAHQFLELCRAGPFYRHLFGLIPDVSDKQKREIAEKTVEMFFRAYGKPSA